MFKDFSNVWTPVVTANRLKNKPLALVVAGEKVVFFRNSKGVAKALIDVCPHRGVALSLGRVTKEGCLECPFHAWAFDGEGHNVNVPLNPDAKRERLFATALSVRELGGVLWLYTSQEKPTHEPVVPPTMLQDDLQKNYLEIEFNAHWTRVMENMLDMPHVPFLHRKTIGRGAQKTLVSDSKMSVEWKDESFGGTITSTIDRHSSGGAQLEFYKPNIMVLTIPIPGKIFRMHALCVPSRDNVTSMLIVGARNFATWSGLNWLFNVSNRKIALEDKAVVESSFPSEVPEPALERSVRTDAPTLKFRKYYFEQLKSKSTLQPLP